MSPVMCLTWRLELQICTNAGTSCIWQARLGTQVWLNLKRVTLVEDTAFLLPVLRPCMSPLLNRMISVRALISRRSSKVGTAELAASSGEWGRCCLIVNRTVHALQTWIL